MSEAFRLKDLSWRGGRVRVLCQNENGPCPLLAIANLLILSGVEFPGLSPDVQYVTLDDCVTLIAGHLLDRTASAPASQNVQFQVDDAVKLLPRLARGMDVNVRFRAPDDFEFTAEMQIFDLLGIDLLHGWLPDPSQQVEAASLVAELNYNQIMERIIDYQAALQELAGGDAPLELPGQTTVQRAPPAPAAAPANGDGEKIAQDGWEPVAGAGAAGGDPPAAAIGSRAADSPGLPGPAEAKREAGRAGSADPADPDPDPDPDGRAGSAGDGSAARGGAAAAAVAEDDGEVKGAGQAASAAAVPVPVPGAGAAAGAPPAGTAAADAEARRRRDVLVEGEVIAAFLNASATQLTYHGLTELHRRLRSGQLACFFRNNHFGTILKEGDAIYQLVTDQGYADVPQIAWERLDAIDGDTLFCTSDFSRVVAPAQTAEVDADYLLAVQMSAEGAPAHPADALAPPEEERLRREEAAALAEARLMSESMGGAAPATQEQADMALALQLQREENAMARERAGQAERRGGRPAARAEGRRAGAGDGRRRKERGCTVS